MANLAFPNNYQSIARRVYRSRKSPDWVVYQLNPVGRFARGTIVRYAYSVDWLPVRPPPRDARVAGERPNLVLYAGLILPNRGRWEPVVVKEFRPLVRRRRSRRSP